MPNHTTTKETQISLIFRKGFKKILPLNIVLLHFIEGSFIEHLCLSVQQRHIYFRKYHQPSPAREILKPKRSD